MALRRAVVTSLLHSFTPKPGQCVFLPAGTVHGLGGGVVLAEVQQTSDATFRLFDWNRARCPGAEPRKLHIEEGLAAIDWKRGPVRADRKFPDLRPSAEEPAGERTLVDCPYFRLRTFITTSTSCSAARGRLRGLVIVSTVPAHVGDETMTRGPGLAACPRRLPATRWCPSRRRDLPAICTLPRRERRMKVLINQTTALRQKAGMGHYIAELVRCLPLEAGADGSSSIPGRFTQLGLASWKHLRGMLGKFKRRAMPATGDRRHAPGRGRWGRRMRRLALSAPSRPATVDLYHEPNYIPQRVRSADDHHDRRPELAAASGMAPGRTCPALRHATSPRASPAAPTSSRSPSSRGRRFCAT